MTTKMFTATTVTKTAVALAVCATVVAGGIAASTTTAEAGHRHHYYWGGPAVAGFAAGAIIGGALAQPRYYYAPPPRAVYVGIRPWSRKWYEYCTARYRSFDPRSGTFVGYDGRRHFCR